MYLFQCHFYFCKISSVLLYLLYSFVNYNLHNADRKKSHDSVQMDYMQICWWINLSFNLRICSFSVLWLDIIDRYRHLNGAQIVIVMKSASWSHFILINDNLMYSALIVNYCLLWFDIIIKTNRLFGWLSTSGDI